MPAYNSEGVLAESVASVQAQTYRDWELVLVDDASRDATLSLAQQLAEADARIRVIALKRNSGVANARNVAMEAARGRYLAFLDSDDLWLPEKLEVQMDFMRRHNAEFSFARYRGFDAAGKLGRAEPVPDSVGYERLLRGNVIGCLTVLIDREKVAPFRMRAIGHEDYAAWLEIMSRGHMAWGIQYDLARYRKSANSVSGNKGRSAAWTWNIYREVENLPFSKAAWCFAQYSLKAAYKHFV
jgi:teichuronic acid biosynthesis glycosyltransferase TuaG